jgi:hypothetical protein
VICESEQKKICGLIFYVFYTIRIWRTLISLCCNDVLVWKNILAIVGIIAIISTFVTSTSPYYALSLYGKPWGTE